MVQLSHPYMSTGKTIALVRQIFVSKAVSLLFNMLSRLVITFLPRNKLKPLLILIDFFSKNTIIHWNLKVNTDMLNTAFLSETSAALISITKTRNFIDKLLPPPLVQLLMT